MARVYISIGSNVEPARNVRSCLQALAELFGTLTVSPVYRNKAVGFEGDDFLNLVVGADTELGVRPLTARLREVEVAHGRRRDAPKFSPRTLDLDLLLYDDLVLEAGGLQLPRDEITRYAFVLKPLADIAGQERHPIFGRSYAELWAEFDQSAQPLTPVTLEAGTASV
ncbi:MAG TPA: 2-amino-4-hydroxy-6-hydroxymethyldihydropteridine diphosphokinase [Candidatus Competibacteraceae bacterium]|nr:2-amino-4-hydroxy-6-hydroxymethyldihydropteridine diphosphokinase [Candidatus Competibacteraceae bacterium]